MTSIIKVNTIQDVGGNNLLISNGSGNITTNKLGIKVAGMWRINSNQNISADTETVINANWEEVDTDSYTRIGGAMSQSSGVWTFPETGIYQINWNVQFRDPSQGATRCSSIINVTTDNSNYDTAADNTGNIYHANGRTSVLSSHIFDVTDTSTHKCKLSALCEFAAACHSATGQSRTWVQFIRLGDT